MDYIDKIFITTYGTNVSDCTIVYFQMQTMRNFRLFNIDTCNSMQK